jgi:precorrin-2 dehydrogenase/sirohydrochlorin ferrochelatase
MRYFPINFDVAGRPVLVVGGGRIALRKVRSLLACGAAVTVVSPDFCAGLARLKSIRRVRRPYRKTDLRGACLVISATDSQAVNERVWAHASAAGIPVNVVDQPDRCTFTVPAVFRRGDLLITISTGGGGPALARRLRERFERDIGPEYGVHVALLKQFRARVQQAGLPAEARFRLLKDMAGDRVREVLMRHGRPAARGLLEEMLAEALARHGQVLPAGSGA